MEYGIAPDAQKFKALLTTVITVYFDYLVEHPHFLRILNWEMAEGWQTLKKILSRRDFEEFDQFRPFLNRMQSLGLLRPGFDPSIQFVMAIYSCQYYLGSMPLYQVLLPNEDFSSTMAVARARDYIVDFVVRGLIVDPAEPEL